MLIVWDLCSGYGGFSEAFYIKSMFPAREYEVFRFENNPDLAQVPKTYLEDVCSWMDWVEKYPAPDIILASPPCLEFSLGYNGPRSKAQRAGEQPREFIVREFEFDDDSGRTYSRNVKLLDLSDLVEANAQLQVRYAEVCIELAEMKKSRSFITKMRNLFKE